MKIKQECTDTGIAKTLQRSGWMLYLNSLKTRKQGPRNQGFNSEKNQRGTEVGWRPASQPVSTYVSLFSVSISGSLGHGVLASLTLFNGRRTGGARLGGRWFERGSGPLIGPDRLEGSIEMWPRSVTTAVRVRSCGSAEAPESFHRPRIPKDEEAQRPIPASTGSDHTTHTHTHTHKPYYRLRRTLRWQTQTNITSVLRESWTLEA
ncbi:hypothetical protein LY76DRAFT_168438 [Colletotrichum caudatum]|nr:hypothetical protein LY76DRAFT_168438 [Colletotrichum caudatum]